MIPICVTASGYAKREIPKSSCPSGIKVIPIPGLCIERNCNPTSQKKEKDLIMNKFAKLFKLTLEQGHIPEVVDDELGFPEDTVGNKVF
eukprot:4676472-Ditylum_brightwellii.AAC.1